MARVVIRDMREEDIRGVLRIEYASFPSPWTEWMFRSQLSLEDIALNLVLVDEEEIIGYAVSWIVDDEIHLLSIAVMPEQRRQGYGRKILEAVIDRGRSRGGCRVILEVRERNVGAQDFYERYGFHRIGKRKGYYVDTGEDAVIMGLVLSPGRKISSMADSSSIVSSCDSLMYPFLKAVCLTFSRSIPAPSSEISITTLLPR